jgi:MFS family permease
MSHAQNIPLRPNGPHQVHYGWTIAGVTFATLLIGGLIRSTSGIMALPIETEFHWTRATISAAVATNMLTYGLIGPFAGSLMEAFSLRRIVLGALATVIGGLTFAPLMHHSWQLILLWGVLVGTGTGITANVFAAIVAARWFAVRRELVAGILASAAAAGQFLFLPAIAELTTNFGWRRASESLTAAAVLLVALVAGLMRDRPEDIGTHRYGELPAEDMKLSTPAVVHNPLRFAFRVLADGVHDREFLLLCASIFISGISTGGLVGTHLILACVDHGMPELTATGLLTSLALFNVIGSSASGLLPERLDPRRILAALYLLRGAALIYLPFAFNARFGLFAFLVLYGLVWVGTLPVTLRLVEWRFKGQRVDVAFGWIVAVSQIGGALATYAAGIMRTVFGTYSEVFMAAGLLCLLAAVLVLFARREIVRGGVAA